MPSPVGHVLGGLVAAFAADSLGWRPRLTMPLLAVSAALAVIPDVDLVVGLHRTYTHSVGGLVTVGVACALIRRARYSSAAGTALLMAAYASHLLLDWFSRDTRAPSGITALWPFTATYYQSPWTVFDETSRRYWLPQEFVLGNLRAVSSELVLLLPLLILAWARWSSRTLKG